jgi:hypothetical protein
VYVNRSFCHTSNGNFAPLEHYTENAFGSHGSSRLLSV